MHIFIVLANFRVRKSQKFFSFCCPWTPGLVVPPLQMKIRYCMIKMRRIVPIYVKSNIKTIFQVHRDFLKNELKMMVDWVHYRPDKDIWQNTITKH